MATIATVEVGAFGMPESDERVLNRTVGISQAGTVKMAELRTADRTYTIVLRGKSTTTKDNLLSALISAQDTTVSIDPDAHIDMGAGAGTAVNAYWMDNGFLAYKNHPDAWDITLKFRKA